MAFAMQPVDSSAISEVGYEPTSKTLRIRYKHGGLYETANVEPHEHEALLNSGSIGRHVHTHFRHRQARVE
jgi:hypothetical protein